jgi:membrane-associated phospholipid phosphatase
VVPGDQLTSGQGSDHRSSDQSAAGQGELVAGVILLAWSLVTAVLIAARPGANALDRWGFEMLAKSPDSATYTRITDVGSPVVMVVGVILAALIVVRRDRVRAAACIVGPALSVILVEFVMKPAIGRHYLGVLSYPSGNVNDIAALATAWAIAVPRRIRPIVIVIGACSVLAMIIAVIGMRWHYPSDALGGAVLGVGVVLFVDGAFHWVSARYEPPQARQGARSSTNAGEEIDPWSDAPPS